MKNEPICERLVFYRKKLKMSRDEVVDHDSTTISKSTLQAWELGHREPSISGVIELANLYGVNVSILMFGDVAGELPKDDISSDYYLVPFYRAEASAGHGAFTDDHRQPTHHLAFRRRWLKAMSFNIKDLVGLVVSGDSMEPTIRDESAIIINTARDYAMDGNIYVIRMGDRLWVKRTQWIPGGGLRLISDNSIYEAFDITVEQLEADDIEVIGQVVHTAYDLVK